MTKIRIIKDTVVEFDRVPRGDVGRLQLKPTTSQDPNRKSHMDYYFPAGTVLEIRDYVAEGNAEEIVEG